MEKKDIVIEKIESYIEGKENKNELYSKFSKALVNLSGTEEDEDIEFLKEAISSSFVENDYIAYEDLELYDDIVNYLSTKVEDRAMKRTM